ncbi:MAG: 50S ribosome-binding GTPase [Gemmataceae bacterium]|nr:50S ribosome-binding GTPase [Gemmataceae bacterium]
MSDTRVSVLTPAGTGAIATVAVAGPKAWGLARWHFRPAGGKPLPDTPERHRFWFGKLADGDEVVLAVKAVEPEVGIEVHCHGGRRVVRWVVEQFLAGGAIEVPWVVYGPGVCTPGYIRSPLRGSNTRSPGGATECSQGCKPLVPIPPAPISRAPTLRTASILLDQYHSAFDRTITSVLADLDAGRVAPQLGELARLAPVGRHLVEPWKVVIAGPPNVGKSSLVNALAGYQRSVVSEVAGTTRDVVTVPVAFDGWPVLLADTAGLRAAAGLEAEGIERAERFIRSADLVVWVLDATAEEPVDWEGEAPAEPGSAVEGGSAGASPSREFVLLVVNKVDQPARWDLDRFPDALRVSAVTGEGVPGLAAAIARWLVPVAPEPGAAVPYSPELADAVEAAHAAASPAEAAAILRAAVGPG